MPGNQASVESSKQSTYWTTHGSRTGNSPESCLSQKSFPLSSLQFAKDNPEYLLAVISHLIECGVSGIAYKPVYYYDLPTEIRDLANSCNFPIFRIENGDTLTYREIICGISDVIRADRIVSDKSNYVKRMASGT